MHQANTREEVINILKSEMPLLQDEYGITKLALFGSFACGNPSSTSDIDLMIESSKSLGFKFFELSDYLSNRLGRKIDLVTFRQVKDSKANPRFCKIAENIEKSLLYV